MENNTLLGLVNESDVRTVENDDETLGNHRELLSTFFIGMNDNWMDILKMFSSNETNVMPVLSKQNKANI